MRVGASTGPSTRSAPSVGHVWVGDGKEPRSLSSALLTRMGPSTLEDGSALQFPSDDEEIPADQHFPLPHSPPFESVNSFCTPPNGDGRDGSTPNLQEPKRPTVASEAPYPQRARTPSQEAQDLEELDAKRLGRSKFYAQHGISGQNQADANELPEEDFDRATRFPGLGWPTYQLLFGDGAPGVRLTQRILTWTAFGTCGGDNSFTRRRGKDSISAALGDAGSQIAPQREFRPLSREGQMECPLEVRNTECTNCRDVEFAPAPTTRGKLESGRALSQTAQRRIQ